MQNSINTAPSPSSGRNAFKDRNWEVLLVSFVFLISLLGTLSMVLVSVFDPQNTDNQFRILPAASIMVMVELWLIIYLPFYGKLAFWGAYIFLATYLFFAAPFAFLQLLPGTLGLAADFFIVVSLVCGLLLFRQRAIFLQAPSKRAG